MWIVLIFCSLPFVTSALIGREDTTTVLDSVLFFFLPFTMLTTIIPYILELRKTYKLAAEQPEPPTQTQRNLVLHSPAAAWLLLSVVIVILTRVFWRFAESLQGCSILNPDVAGLGVRVSLWVPAIIVMWIAVSSHYHAEETGIKVIAPAVLGTQIIYIWNLWTKELSSVDKLVGSMILDCLIFLAPITFSMKECLAARQLIRVGYLVQFLSTVVLVRTMSTFHRTRLRQSNTSVESCPCFQAYWWTPALVPRQLFGCT